MTAATETKAENVRRMFDGLAPRYDLMNRMMTLGRDQAWRRFVVDRAQISQNGVFLDLASGTGDIAFEVKKRYPAVEVVAGDFSLGMLERGRIRPGGAAITWVACDAMNLPFGDAVFDGVTFGYLLRNVEDIDRTLAEVLRILKPGGRVVCLDTSPPPRGLLRPFVRCYLKYGLPLLGRMIAGQSSAYAYLSQSTLGFEEPEQLRTRFQQSGFQAVEYRRFMFGTIAVHWCQKPATAAQPQPKTI